MTDEPSEDIAQPSSFGANEPAAGEDAAGRGEGSLSAPTAATIRRLEGRLARLEAQVQTQADRLLELDQGARSKKRHGLAIRLVLLLAALAAFVFLKVRAGA